ncbi:hypothetical protein JOM56_015198 [Amanita muscaria]
MNQQKRVVAIATTAFKRLPISTSYNLGISCINLRRFEEAAQHISDALVLQDNFDFFYAPPRRWSSPYLILLG